MKLPLIICFNLLFLSVIGQPSYKGGQKNLNSLIINNLIYPEYSKQNCLQGTIEISFKVDKKGRVVESHVEKGPGIDLDKEALRIVRLTSGKWIVPENYDTTVALVMPINFSLKEYNCEQRSSDDLKASIAAYKAREDLTNAVLNFYDNKTSGDYEPDDELQIEELKAQLGYNEKFINRTLRQAQQKLRQGDRQGACEDLNFVRRIGSDRADKLIAQHCN
jgi:TonB family protein